MFRPYFGRGDLQPRGRKEHERIMINRKRRSGWGIPVRYVIRVGKISCHWPFRIWPFFSCFGFLCAIPTSYDPAAQTQVFDPRHPHARAPIRLFPLSTTLLNTVCYRSVPFYLRVESTSKISKIVQVAAT
ncbi:hypothetical protein BJY01DRAFT_213938 [Aspergillus pseudoustus]|uniref:Uncharacterized protein n=1 Tax=Aspergillus pseudoustus TaxID=1810923 RepID=A0ABR4K086_9EURO